MRDCLEESGPQERPGLKVPEVQLARRGRSGLSVHEVRSASQGSRMAVSGQRGTRDRKDRRDRKESPVCRGHQDRWATQDPPVHRDRRAPQDLKGPRDP
jgi:hypothetical protein